ncbi:Thiamin pyrophosphokinase 1 [Cytospora mali]|uniref:Thiamine pyrophosphokinase n=1 Tax=Cytospora mali TaxID=578113 RepID=A0A194VXE8_CYTMA|nr:Thiamin pyrophosphokinase 1 [Valsa mali]
MGEPTAWYPARILREQSRTELGDDASTHRDGSNPFALIILNQPLRDIPTLKRVWQNSCLRLAADGGANRVLDVCQSEQDDSKIFDNLDIIIGDLDSLSPDAKQYFTTRPRPTKVIHDPDQYSTDFGKAVKWIRSSADDGPVDIVSMGGLGGRVDQGLSQLHHLYVFQADPEYREGRMFLVSGESLTFLLKTGKHHIHVRERNAKGDLKEDVFAKYAGIIPIKEPSVITLKGFEWDVTDWKTEFGGMMSTSNHVLPETEVLEIETTKDVLFTIALKR